MPKLCSFCGATLHGLACDNPLCGGRKRISGDRSQGQPQPLQFDNDQCVVFRISWVAVAFALPFFILGITCLLSPEAVKGNRNIREGMQKALGQPSESYNLVAATVFYVVTPGVLLVARALFAPSFSQVIATAIGGLAMSVVLTSFIFGSVETGLSLPLETAAICILYDFLQFLRKRRNDGMSGRARRGAA